MQHDLQRSERERVSQDMMPYTAKLVSAVMERQNVPKEEFARFVGDIHRAMIDISFESFAIAEDLGLAAELAVPAAAEPPRPARGASMGQIVQSLLHPKETLFEPPVPHSVRVPTSLPRPPASARLPVEPPAVAQPPQVPTPPALPVPAAPAVASSPEPAPAPAKAKAPAPARRKSSPDQSALPFEAAPITVPAPAPAPVTGKAPSRSSKDRRRYEGPERRSDPLPDKSVDFAPLLPRKLSSIEEALTEDYIVCLEDGKMVKDLEEYLRKKGMTPDQYRSKWKLPPQYPMIAPNTLVKRGVVHEMDPVSGRIFRARV